MKRRSFLRGAWIAPVAAAATPIASDINRHHWEVWIPEGAYIHDAARLLTEQARNLKMPVRMHFNGRAYVATPETDWTDIVREHHELSHGAKPFNRPRSWTL